MIEVFTVRLDSRNAEWVARQSEASGLSKAAVVEVCVEDARLRGGTVERRRGAVVGREDE